MSERHTQNGSSESSDYFPEELLTAYALGQLAGAERGEIERMLANPAQTGARELVAEVQRLGGAITAARAAALPHEASASLRAAIEQRFSQPKPVAIETPSLSGNRRPWHRRTIVQCGLAVAGAVVFVALLLPALQSPREVSRQADGSSSLPQRRVESDIEETRVLATTSAPAADPYAAAGQPGEVEYVESESARSARPAFSADSARPTMGIAASSSAEAGAPWYGQSVHGGPVAAPDPRGGAIGNPTSRVDNFQGQTTFSVGGVPGSSGQGLPATPLPFGEPRVTLHNGQSGDQKELYKLGKGSGVQADFDKLTDLITTTTQPQTWDEQGAGQLHRASIVPGGSGGEQYEPITENAFLAPLQQPLSTFSIDVDTASYANMRRFLTSGSLPPPNAVRIEELVNYFRYDYPQPKGPEPFSVNMEVAECPWAESHMVLRVGLKGKDVHRGERPQSNLVFLLDVSGSMADENKLPLLKTAMQMFTRELGENDRVSIVTYAGEAGLRLPPTRGHEQAKILAAIESLSSGGSTNGSAGIDLAYEQARAYFVEGGTNRVILCTDGDLNVGITDDDALVQLIKQKAAGGTFLTVLGFGEGNLKDGKMEKLADNGNGLFAYIDSVREARKVLVEQMTGSTITIAKDVKIQIEFNPAVIASYRLLGYENRVLAAQDFNDDKKDAGEIGAGHTVTALYELVPVGAKAEAAVHAGVEPLKYQAAGGQKSEVRGHEEAAPLTDAAKSGELLTLKLRYKEPAGQESKLIEFPLKDRGGKFNGSSKDLQFAAAVASFGMILRGSEHKGSSNIAAVEEIASGAIGEDAGGYRAEFVDLVRKAQTLGAR